MARILLADDLPAFTALLRTVLEGRGHTVVECGDGAEALAALARGTFDLIIVDMMMPGLDGIETVRRLRTGGCTTPVVAMSGGSDDFPAVHSLTMSEMHGANRVLFKPFDNDELLAVVDELLAAHRA